MKRFILILIVMMCSASVMIHAESKQGTATKTEQVTNQATDKNPIVGTDKKAGKIRKAYLSKAEKEEFYKTHPNVKRPTNN